MRKFHTVKGSAGRAAARRLGERVQDMETRIESAMQLASVPPMIVEDLQSQYDRAMSLFDDLQHPQAIEISRNAAAAEEARERGEALAGSEVATTASVAPGAPLAPVIELAAARKEAAREWVVPEQRSVVPTVSAPAATFIRVRADVLDKLVDQAGEVAISRSRLENEVGTLKGSLSDLTENIGRLRTQLREVEIQADAQIAARSEKVNKSSSDFDPLEFDRYSRLQELTRLLVESVEDVAMVQSNMLKRLSLADTDLTAQSRLTRQLQTQLMPVQLGPFSNIGERLYRVARQTAKELDKRVALEIRGGTVEIDRGVLERMGGPFEHLVRNAIVHGLETPAERRAAGKSDTGELTIDVRQEGNELVVVVGDNGAGLNLPRIRSRATEKGLLAPDQSASERELTELIFAPGFSTATEVTELAGRGVGMDVVRAELSSFGGRVAVTSEAGVGTRFTLYLPLTPAVTPVFLAKVGARRHGNSAAVGEQVRRFKPAALAPALASGTIDFAPLGSIVLRTLAQLLGEVAPLHHTRQVPVVLLRSGDDRLAIALDDMSSNQEVVVKSVGVQVSRLAGVLGATILGNGEIVLIVNPVQYIARASEPSPSLASVPLSAAEARRSTEAGTVVGAPAVIMVVDDSLTVRRVTQRFLERSGFDVMLAKDGVDALRQLQDVKPDVMLVDIEMPRMDGYELTRNVRRSSGTRAN